MEHGQVVFGLFGPPNEQVAEAVEPGVCPLDWGGLAKTDSELR